MSDFEWCEHCRDHFNKDHYDAELVHKAGKQYGYYGYLLECDAVLKEIAVSDDREVSAHRLTSMAKKVVL